MIKISSVCCCALIALVVGTFPTPLCAQFGEGGVQEQNSFAEVDGEAGNAAERAGLADEARTASTCHCIGDAGGAAADRIERVLSAPLKDAGLSFSEEPLESIVSFLKEEYEVPIQLDASALGDVGLTPDEPTTLDAKGISLKSALRLMLRPHGLTYMIANETLIITSPEVAEERLMVCVYDVRDLINARYASKELDKLVGVVIACIAPETWTANGGGEADIHPLLPGLLVVSQTRPVHEQIADLFAATRKILRHPAGQARPTTMGGMLEGEMFMGRGGYGEYGGGYGREGGYGGRGGRGGFAPPETE